MNIKIHSKRFTNYTFVEFSIVIMLVATVSLISNFSRAAELSGSTVENLSQIHVEIDALPIAPEVREQMLLFIEIAETKISEGEISAAREAVLDFCRRIEWYRYQIGHTKIDAMFNQAMGIAVDLHNSLG